MPTLEHLQALGTEIDRLRIARDIPSIAELARKARVSNGRLGEIIRGYKNPQRGYTIPSDDVLERLAEVLVVPVSRLHALLGRFPDEPLPAYFSAETKELAEAYDVLPAYGKKLLKDVLKSVQETILLVEERRASS